MTYFTRLAALFFLGIVVFSSLDRAQVPVFVIRPEESFIEFSVKASVAIEGTFDKWESTVTFATPDVMTAVLAIKIQANSRYWKRHEESHTKR